MGHPDGSISPELGSGVNFSEIEQARCWMFATDHYLPLMTKAKIERRIPPLFLESATRWHEEWRNHAHDPKSQLNITSRSCKDNAETTLLEYLQRLSYEFLSKNRDEQWYESVNSFVNFIRQHLDRDAQGYLNDMFPAETLEDQIPPLFLESAAKWYEKWFEQADDLKIRYDIISYPRKGIDLLEYLQQLSHEILPKEKDGKWWESLNSFANFIRNELNYKDLHHLNNILPLEKNVQGNCLIRLVKPQKYPIDQFSVVKIIQNLISIVLTGRRDAQRNAAQALGLLWICLTCAFSRITSEINQIRELSLSDLSPSQPLPALSLLTSFGKKEAPISFFLHDYLQLLGQPKSSLFFLAPQSCLDRVLRRAIEQANLPYPGKITFLTFMSLPQEVPGHRYQQLVTSLSP